MGDHVLQIQGAAPNGQKQEIWRKQESQGADVFERRKTQRNRFLRFFFFEHPKMSISCQLHVHPCHWLAIPRTRDLPPSMKQLACAPRSTGPQIIPRPTTTESKTLQVELQRTLQPTSANQKRATNSFNQAPLLQNNQERTNRNTTDTMEGPETT